MPAVTKALQGLFCSRARTHGDAIVFNINSKMRSFVWSLIVCKKFVHKNKNMKEKKKNMCEWELNGRHISYLHFILKEIETQGSFPSLILFSSFFLTE